MLYSFFRFHDFVRARRNLRLKTPILQMLQNKKLIRIIKHAYNNTPYYHRKFDEAGVKLSDIKSVSDIVKIPFTTKFEIQSNLNDVTARNMDMNKCRRTTTTGSTGIPLTVFIDRRSANIHDAVWVRAHLERGLNFFDKIAVIRTPRSFRKRGNFYDKLGFIKRKYISVYDNPEVQLNLLKEFNPDVIRSYPSALATLAFICKRDFYEGNTRLIFTSADLLEGAIRKLISSTFQGELYDNYSCNEVALIAWECKRHSGYHVNVDTLLVEFLKNGEPVSDGERGEIVITDLTNKAMPLIRYKIGDLGVLSDEQCSCGITLPLMKVIEGRKDDFIQTLDGRIISPHQFKRILKDIFGCLGVKIGLSQIILSIRITEMSI